MSIRIALVVLLCGLLFGGGSDEPARAVAAPTVTVTTVSPTSLEVRWQSTGTDPHRWWVILTDANDRSIGQRTACGACRSVTVEHLAPGSPYNVRVVGLEADGSFGEFTPVVVGRTTARSECRSVATSATCVQVGSTHGLEADGVGLGFLHGVTAETDPARVAALQPKAWRVAANDVERFRLARQHGAEVTVFLSDPWMRGPSGPSPWDDWAFYRWWVGIVVDAHVTNGLIPDHWEIQNEPGYGSYNGTPATPELVWEQHRVAAEEIHERLPGASVLGPAAGYPNFGFGLADLEYFLDREVTTPGTIQGLSWHEIGASCLGYCDGSPRAVLQHADDARAALAARRLEGVELHVNEWGAPWNIRQPGAIVGYLASLAQAGVDSANTTCWSARESIDDQFACTGTPGTLTGLLLDDGRTPTDAWWTHKGYADMTGPGFRLLPSTIADPAASVVATVDPSGTTRVAIGRHTGCDLDADEHCPGFRYGPDRKVHALVSVPGKSGRYRATTTTVDSRRGAMSSAPPSTSRVVQARSGVVDLGAITVGDGDALFITLQPI